MSVNVPLLVEFVYEIEIEHPDRHEMLIAKVLQQAAELEGIGGEVVVSLVDDNRMRELNREYRGKDVPTDVLSFPMLEPGEDEPDIYWEEDDGDVGWASETGQAATGESEDNASEQLELLGDIVVSWPTAERQAQEYDHSLEREAAFLALHGLLHLYGYDHENDADEKKMVARQREVMERVGLPRK